MRYSTVALPRPTPAELRSLLKPLRRTLVLMRQPDLVAVAERIEGLIGRVEDGTTSPPIVYDLLTRLLAAAQRDRDHMALFCRLLTDEFERYGEPNPFVMSSSPVFAAVIARPDDTHARLVLADWLDENTRDDQGAFIRASIELANFAGPDRERAEGALAALSGETLARRFAALGFVTGALADDDWMVHLEDDRVTVHTGDASGTYARGMLAELNVTQRTWVTVARTVLETTPLERATITDVPGLSFAVEPPGGQRGWLLRALQTVGGAESVATREFESREALLTGVVHESDELFTEVHGL